MYAASPRWRDPGGMGWFWWRGLRWEGGEGGRRGCLGNRIAEPVPERYRFTLSTIPALLVKAEPQGGERRGRGESHTCRALLEMKETFEFQDLDTTAQPYRADTRTHTHTERSARVQRQTYMWYFPSLVFRHVRCMSELLKRTEYLICAHKHTAHRIHCRGDDRRTQRDT